MRELLDRRDALDVEIAEMAVSHAVTVKKDRKPLTCSICQSSEHTARTCPQKP